MPVTLAPEDVVYADPPPEEQPPPEQQPLPEQTAPLDQAAPAEQPAPTEAPPQQAAPVADATVPVAAPPPPPPPAPVDAAATAPVAEPGSLEALAAGPQPGLSAPTSPPPPPPGPLEQAANAVGQEVAPLIAQAPDPVQNLANIVGQPVGGLVSDVQQVADARNVAGAIGAITAIPGGPQQRMKEQAGERVAQGLPANPSVTDNAPQSGLLTPLLQPLADTGVGQAIGNVLSAPLPGTGNLPAPPTAAGAIAAGPDPGQAMASLPGTVLGTGIDDWAKANPDAVQQAYQVGGGAGVVDAYVKQLTHASEGAAPPQFVNPFDNTTGSGLDKAVQVAGNIPRAIGGVVSSGRQGTLGPFVEEQAIQTAMDPTIVIPGELTGHLAESAGEHIRALPGVRTLVKPAAGEVARLAGEQAVSGMGEVVNAARRQGEFEARYGTDLAPAEPLGAATPPTPGEANAAPAAPAPETTITPRISDQLGTETFRVTTPTGAADFATLEQAQAAHPGARVLPGRAELVQQFEDNLPALIDLAGRVDPLSQQRLSDAIFAQNPDAFPPTEAAAIRRRQGVRAAYDATPPGFQRTVEQRIGTDTHMYHGLTMSEEAVRLANEPASRSLVFRDRWSPQDMTLGDVAEKMMSDTDAWLAGFDAMGIPKPPAEQPRGWRTLNDRLNPNGDAPILDLKRSGVARDAHMVGILTDAASNGLPAAKRTAIGKMFATYTNVYRTAQLFNVLNVPHYFLQNLITNPLNMAIRGGGIRPVMDLFTNVNEAMRVYGNQLDRSSTIIDALESRTGQSRPNIKMTQRPYLDRIGGALPKWIDVPLKVIAPESVRAIASIPDIRAREDVGAHAIFEGYKDLNARMPAMIEDRARKTSPTLTPAPGKAAQVFRDFTEQYRTLEDPRTGQLRTGLLGQVETHEPTWHPEELRPYLREHLFEDMPTKPTAGQMNRVVNDVLGQSRDAVRSIWDDANATTDSALFSWRNTKGDALLGQATLYHYWMTRQGGFYVSEMAKHPWVAAAYGRMVGEMQQQNQDLGGPAWLTGWFQFMNSPAGFSVWMSPFDVVQSLLTFPDAMTGENDPTRFEDLTAVGHIAKNIPFLIHPAILTVAQQLGLLGPDARVPDPTGIGTFGVNAINAMNLANFQDAPFMKLLNEHGVGVDANGNKIPLAPRPIQDLLARTGNALSSALEPITGLSPDEATPSWATMVRDIQTIGEQEVRKAHPEWDDGSGAGQRQISGLVTSIMADPGNPEYQRWAGLAAQEPYQLGAGVPPLLAAFMRIASPIQIKSMPEQRALDSMKGLLPSGNAPMRGAPDPNDPTASDAFDAAKYGASKTVEGRLLAERVDAYTNLSPPDVSEANTMVGRLIGADLPDGSITIGGQTYTNADLAGMDYDTKQGVINAYLQGQGVTQAKLDSLKTDREQYLADHPDVAAYNVYKSLVYQQPGADSGAQAKAFTDQMRQTNPGFAQYYQSQMVNHVTGEVKYGLVFTTDAFLAATGGRPSVYSPTVGNEPSTAEGGYPSIPGADPGQPITPTGNVVGDTYVYADKGDIVGGKYSDPAVAVAKPDFPIRTLGQPVTVNDKYNNGTYVPTTHQMILIAQPDNPDKPLGWIDASLIRTSAPGPTSTETVPRPGGGLTKTAGQLTNTLGGAKDALLGGVSGAIGGALGAIGGAVPEPTPPTASAPAPAQQTAPAASAPPGMVAATPPEYAPIIQQAAQQSGVPASILSAMLQQESQFTPNAVSPTSGAQGIAQFMPDTAAGMGIDPFDPNQAIPAAAQYLASLHQQFGTWEQALAAYNWGPDNLANAGGDWHQGPQETLDYVPTIMANANAVGTTPASPATASAPTGSGNPLDAVGSALGAVMDAAGNVITTLGGGHDSGTPQQPTTTTAPGITPGKVVVVPAPDGMGIATDPVPTDQTWLEDMIGHGHATVTVQYKGGHPGPETPDPSKATGVSTWYDYQLGHGATNLVHAAVDVSCDTGNCEGTPIYAPVDGTIGCAGYGVGDSGNPAATCNYSAGTTTNNVKDGSAPAHDVTITMGTDPQGNQLILELAHIGTATLTPGQQVKRGDLIATMGNGDCPDGPCPHTHVEAWGYSPELGAFRMIDPNLVMNGYYQTHGVDEGISPGS